MKYESDAAFLLLLLEILSIKRMDLMLSPDSPDFFSNTSPFKESQEETDERIITPPERGRSSESRTSWFPDEDPHFSQGVMPSAYEEQPGVSRAILPDSLERNQNETILPFFREQPSPRFLPSREDVFPIFGLGDLKRTSTIWSQQIIPLAPQYLQDYYWGMDLDVKFELKKGRSWDIPVFFPKMNNPGPYWIDIMSNGNFIISNTGYEIVKYPTWKGDGWPLTLNLPKGAFIRAVAVDRYLNRDDVYVGFGETSPEIRVYDKKGKFQRYINPKPAIPGFEPHAFCFISPTEMLVADSEKCKLHVMTRQGVILKSISLQRIGTSFNSLMREISYDHTTGLVYIAIRQQGGVVVLELSTGNVKQFWPNTIPKSKLPPLFQLSGVHGVSFDPTNKVVYVSDTNRISPMKSGWLFCSSSLVNFQCETAHVSEAIGSSTNDIELVVEAFLGSVGYRKKVVVHDSFSMPFYHPAKLLHCLVSQCFHLRQPSRQKDLSSSFRRVLP